MVDEEVFGWGGESDGEGAGVVAVGSAWGASGFGHGFSLLCGVGLVVVAVYWGYG